MTTMNPFLVQSTLPYLAPHFDQIANHHYRPAFDEGMQQKRAEIAAIALNPQPPDFNNTILALEQSGELLTRVTSVFFAMTAAHTNDELQRLDEQFSAELAELANDIYLNGELFARVDAVWQRRESLGLDSESIRLVEVIHQRFVLAGAKLEQADKAKLKVLNTEAATLTSQFNQRLLAANKSGGLVVNDIAQLAGMSEQEIVLAAEAAREKGLDNNWLIPLLNTTQQPALHPQVFARYARHYQSGAAMPDELQQKMRNASLFNKGYEMSELLSAALLDMRWHCLEENEAMQDVDDFELRALVAENMDLPAIPPRYRSSYFAHIFGGGYAAGYYAYLWTQMLADDGYQWFVEQGGLTRENGRRFREAILSRGNSEDLERLYRQWRGKAPQIMPMLQHRGLNV
ncbi:TPA: hypothetical protein JW637_001506 [Escherichia coli]|nr:hypothetical protein [Escherichia coli]